jgi:hypothetical protein
MNISEQNHFGVPQIAPLDRNRNIKLWNYMKYLDTQARQKAVRGGAGVEMGG